MFSHQHSYMIIDRGMKRKAEACFTTMCVELWISDFEDKHICIIDFPHSGNAEQFLAFEAEPFIEGQNP